MMKNNLKILLLISFLFVFSCNKDEIENRNDNAVKLNINLSGSIQNPAFSPDGKIIIFTNFRKGYNKPPSDIYSFNLETEELKILVNDGSSNVNLPGECWNKISNLIVFSSDREPHDEIFYINSDSSNGSEIAITSRQDSVAFEPTFSPDGKWIVFESHKLDEEKNGAVVKYKVDGTSDYIFLTSLNENCKQPNWSPTGDKILYQKEENNQWDIWIMNIDGSDKAKITNFSGNKTDAVFSSDGKYVIFSWENDDNPSANIYKVAISGGSPERLTDFNGYDGAPAISPDGTSLIFESSQGDDPNKTDGTELWLIKL